MVAGAVQDGPPTGYKLEMDTHSAMLDDLDLTDRRHQSQTTSDLLGQGAAHPLFLPPQHGVQ